MPEPPLRVRAAREDELDEVARLWGELYVHQRAHGMMLPLRDDAVEVWKRQMNGRLDSPVSLVLVAEKEGGGIVGILTAQVKRLPPHLATGNPKIGIIPEVFVREEARGLKAGRALVEAALDWFRRGEVGSVEVQIVMGNDGAKKFWGEMGFDPEILQVRRFLSA